MKGIAAVADLKPPPTENLVVDILQGHSGSVKKMKSPITATSYTVAALQTTTNSFSQEFLIGEGSLGRVYRGEFSNGKVTRLLHIRSYSFLCFILVCLCSLVIRNWAN